MTFYQKLITIWKKNNSMLCVGLDPDKTKLPHHLNKKTHPLFSFNKHIIDATADLVCAYKPQIAYYAAQEAETQLAMTIDYIHKYHPHIPVILDAKRSDIGNTAQMYAREAFERYNADAVTLNPYMGSDSIAPFLTYKNKGIFILCRTSNPDSGEFQNLMINTKPIYQIVAEKAINTWNKNNNIALVFGATYPEELGRIRKIVGNMPILVPGIGTQGGDIKTVVKKALAPNGLGLIMNSSRDILYSGPHENFAQAARSTAKKIRDAINETK
jgi:orotidine-5'-phosphate decarboxylase